MRRFEYRYFNGVRWTSDVAVNGQRYVDTPLAQVEPGIATKRPERGKSIASFVLAISAVFVGWIPFIFVLAAGAAIAAIVFGVLGLRAAKRHDGNGRRFALAGLALSPFALAVCVGGLFFTRSVVREFRDFAEPGPNELVVDRPCVVANGEATLNGRIHNLDARAHAYRIVVDFDDGNGDRKLATARVRGVEPGATADWTASAPIKGNAAKCNVSDVSGPLPFGGDGQD